MEEKVLIKSKLDEKVEKVLRYIMLVLFALSILGGIVAFCYYVAPHAHGLDEVVLCIIILISVGFALFALLTMVLYFCYTQCELTVTEKNIKGKRLFGKEVVLPIYMVSAFATKELFSIISIATSSGYVKFGCIANYKEIGEVLTSLISERQEKTEVENTPANTDSLQQLKQLKELLDSGIITQEEFDAKKKQILGL